MTVRTVDRLEDVPDPAPDADYVVVDVLISSTSIVRLLEAGADYVRPFADPEAARAFKAETGAVLLGEQGGQPVEGFDGSPLPSTVPDDVAGRPVGLLTSNGTRAVQRIGHDRDVFVGTTVNAAAVAETLADRDGEAWLVAAGRAGDRTPEDSAGVELVARHYRDDLTDEAAAALAEQVRESGTAEWFRDIGFDHEVEALLAFDTSDTVPHLRDGRFVEA
ncbi:MAG: 2-phosphosulfolactate phosphatase [Halorientalis sp.]